MTMTYPGNTGEVSGRLMRAGDVEQLSRRSGSTTRFVAPGSFTGGQFGLYEWDMPADAGGASPHFHRTFSESFYITAGTVQLYDGKDWADAERYFGIRIDANLAALLRETDSAQAESLRADAFARQTEWALEQGSPGFEPGFAGHSPLRTPCPRPGPASCRPSCWPAATRPRRP